MKSFYPLLIISVFLVTACSPGEDRANLIQGVWKVTKILNLDEKTEIDPGYMHYIVTEAYIMTLGGKEGRPIVNKVFSEMTPEEIMSQLPAGGGFMEYVIVDGKIHRTIKFALSELFVGKLIKTEFETDGQNLVFRDNHHADGQLREWHMIRVE